MLEREDASGLPSIVNVVGGETGHNVERAACPGHGHGEQPVPAGLAQCAKIAQQPAVWRAAISHREHHSVTALRHSLVQRQHGKRLGLILQEEIAQISTLGQRGEHGRVYAGGVLRAGGHHHERFFWPLDGVFHHQLHHASYLDIDGLHGSGDRVRRTLGIQGVQVQTAVAQERSGPWQRLNLAAVEPRIHQLRQVFTASTVAAGQRERWNKLGQSSQCRIGMQCVGIDRHGRGALGLNAKR